MKAFDPQDERLSAYVDGALDGAQRQAVERLLTDSPQARALVEALRENRAALATLPREHAPAGVAEAVRLRLERQALLDDAPAETSVSIRPMWRGLAYAAILALTVTVGFYTLQSTVRMPLPAVESLAMARKSGKLEQAPSETPRSEGVHTESRLKSLAYLPDIATAGRPAPSVAAVDQPPVKPGAATSPTALADAGTKLGVTGDGFGRMKEPPADRDESYKLAYQFAADDAALDNRLTLHVAEPQAIERVLKEVRSQATQLQLVEAGQAVDEGDIVTGGMAGGTAASAVGGQVSLGRNQVMLSASPERIGELVSNICRSPIVRNSEVEFTSQGDVSRTWGESEKLAMNLRRNTANVAPPSMKKAAADDDATPREQTVRKSEPVRGLRRDRALTDKESDDQLNKEIGGKKTDSPRGSETTRRGRVGGGAGGGLIGGEHKDKQSPRQVPASGPRDELERRDEKTPASTAPNYRGRHAILIITVQAAPSSQPASRNAP